MGNNLEFGEIETVAKDFFEMVNAVKGGLSVTDVQGKIPDAVIMPDDGPITLNDVPEFVHES
jgi:hypothetical protein